MTSEQAPVPMEYPNCFVCRTKYRQLSDAILSDNPVMVRDINLSLTQHLKRSHVPEVTK